MKGKRTKKETQRGSEHTRRRERKAYRKKGSQGGQLLLLLLSRFSLSDSVRPHRRQPTRLHRPWDSPGKNTGVGCHFLLQCMKVKSESEVAQSCPTLSDPAAYQAPPSMGFSRQEYWSGLPLPSPREGRRRKNGLPLIPRPPRGTGILFISSFNS